MDTLYNFRRAFCGNTGFSLNIIAKDLDSLFSITTICLAKARDQVNYDS